VPAAEQSESAEASAQARRLKVRVPELAALLGVLAVLILYFSLGTDHFLTSNNLLNVLTAIAVTGIIATPGTMLLVAGQFDLSVGSGAAFCGVVLAVAAAHQSISVAVLIALAAGIGIGAINGFLVTVIGVNALITTLGTLAVFSGLAEIVASGQTVLLNGFGTLGTSRPAGIPLPVIIFLGVIIAGALAMRYTTFGRSLYAVGANPAAARLVGIRRRAILFLTFVFSGLAVALSGLILTSQLSAASPTAATGLELQVITVIVLGGASLGGGRGTMFGTLIGLVIIGVLNNGLTLLNVSSFWQNVANGALLIFAVSLDQLRQRFAGHRQ
jgi:ribose transport system permease protein